jgi:hypothetical protein
LHDAPNHAIIDVRNLAQRSKQMTKADILVDRMSQPDAWARGIAWNAQRLQRNYGYDKMDPEFKFVYFDDKSVAGFRPLDRSAWVVTNR